MQQRSTFIDLPQFTDVSTFAFKLVGAYTSWQAPGTGEDVFSYFARNPRPTGDEHGLRATLIRERILPILNYDPAQIEYESKERFDLVLRSKQKDRHKIAIIETKSSSIRNLAVIRRRQETPVEQLERYLSQAGLYLGVLTNGDEWHLFDFAVGHEPLASLSFIELATLLQGASTPAIVEQRLNNQPLLRQALSLILYYLDALRWEQTEVFRQHLANEAYYHIASLQVPGAVETLVQQIKHVLGSLRETIRAQFSLLQQRYAEYEQRSTYTSSTDGRAFEDVLQRAIEKVGEFGPVFSMGGADTLRQEIIDVLTSLAGQYFVDGDISAFESEYLQRAQVLLTHYQLHQTSLVDKKMAHSVRVLPPTKGLNELITLLQTHYDYLQTLNEDYELSKNTVEAYLAWKSSTRGVFRYPQDEFCLQTAYIHFVRLFFVRVCEDNGLIPRRISNGPFTRYEAYRNELLSGIKDTYLRLLEETYQRARSVYHNFFGRQELYDWFALDEYTILALFDLLNRYNFQGLSSDVLGRVYNEGYIETKDRSEKGQFYTPPQVVGYMLDTIGIPTSDEPDAVKARGFLEKSVGDLSCGSGTFLVVAAARKSAILQRLVAQKEIEPEYALQLLTQTFLGFDLNPFACYLAEINLLIQCLPLLLNAEGQLCRSVDRFHIYCTDALEPTVAEQVRALVDGTATERLTLRASRRQGHIVTRDERAVLRIKDGKGLPTDFTQFDVDQRGIDYLLGNPPYVSAGESSDNLLYRNEVWTFGTYHLLHQRWDLFVPFFERNLQFLRPETGRLGLIVSRGIETEGYAEKLRHVLSSQHRILQIDFFPGLRLFQDAAVENTVVLLENRLPDDEHEVIRRKHVQADCTRFETLPVIQQLDANGQLFRWRYDRLLDQSLAEGSVPLCAIVYIGTGVEAQSKESFDTTIDGQRQKLFTLDDVFLPPSVASTRPVEYTEDGVLGNDVDSYYLRRMRFMAYEKYLPKMRRRRHITLFRTPEKLLLGETSGGYYDRAGLFANHSVQVVVPWKALETAGAIEEKGIKTVLRESRQVADIAGSLSPISDLFDLRYLLGVINSRFIRNYLAANRLEGTREGRIYPDVWKRLPIKVASTERQKEVAQLADAVQAHYKQLASRPTVADLAANPTLLYHNIQAYLVRLDLRFSGDIQSTIAEKPTLRDGRLVLHRQPLTYLEAPTAPELLRYLELYLTQLHPDLQGRTWSDARSRIQIPPSIEAVRSFLASVDAVSAEEQHIRKAIDTLLQQIEVLVEAIYQEAPDVDKMQIIEEARSGNTRGGLF
ncbi:MAG: hypothetical protein NVSMB38_16060 [Ktedonobacteraceae bacterium]